MKGISVIICCYNSASRLPLTIKHLSLQAVSVEIPVEIIIVDNASTDNTQDVAAAEWNKYKSSNIEFKIVSESEQGLSYAREKGIYEAKYEYLLFCDDDNWLTSNYISTAFGLMERNKGIGVLCGNSIPTDQQLPIWFTSYQSDYAIGVQGLYSGDISDRGFCWGAGMVLRRSVLLGLKSSGFTPLLSDRKGDTLTSGGDSEICKWFLIAGYNIWYEEALTFYHYIPEKRLSKEYLVRLRESFVSANKYLRYYDYYIYLRSRRENPLLEILKAPYHFCKWVLLKNFNSKLYLFSVFPLPIVERFDSNYFTIRKAAEVYKKSSAGHLIER